MTAIPPVWENPAIQGINRLPMRSPLLPFPSREAALADALAGPEFRVREDNPFHLSLDGTWSFRLLKHPDEDRPDAPGEDLPPWTAVSYNAAGWSAIRVPGAWSLQGWDKPHYTNVQMPFDRMPPRAPEHNPTGLYRRTFTLPPSWRGRRVVLRIGSAESCCLVYVNGLFAGAGKDTRLPQEYDITAFLTEAGEHTLCLKVVRYSDASYIEDQDQWWFGGLHRSVCLYSTEDCYIQDIKAIPGLVMREASASEGVLDIQLTLGGKLPRGRGVGNAAVRTAGESPFVIRYALYPAAPYRPGGIPEAKGELPPKAVLSGEMSLDCDYRINSNQIETRLPVSGPALWSHETPNLYALAVDLFRDGRHIESAAFCTGFRSVRIAKRELLINEKAVLIKGVNRHEHDEKTGKTLSAESMVRDIKLLKQHNFNAVRTSHYPNDERWYELCDRYGIYLVDEANLEHHCFYDQLCRDSAWSYAYISRVQRMTERDKNHPSVIVWSLGNESGDGGNTALCAAWVRRYDPSRPLNYEGAVRPEKGQGDYTLSSLCRGRGITDIIGPMYPPIPLLADFAEYRDRAGEDERPLIMCEYSHAMGNSNGCLADYWELIENRHGLQGGFIWDWIDQGIEARTRDGVDGSLGRKYWKYGGDFADEPTDYDFCLNGLLFPDRSVKPAMAECRQLFSPVRLKPVPGRPYAFTVENRFDFSSLDAVALRWRLCTESAVLLQGTEAFPAVAPGGSAEIALPIPEAGMAGFSGAAGGGGEGILYIHADICLKNDGPWAGAGFVIGSAERIIRERMPYAPQGRSETAASGDKSGLAGFADLFYPSLFRVPTENDGLKTYRHLRGDPAAAFYYKDKAMYSWLDLDLLHLRCLGERTEAVSWEGRPALRHTAELFSGSGAAEGFENTRLGFYTRVISEAGGLLIMDVVFDLSPDLPELPCVGITAKIPAYYRNITWFGAGPHESYPDRSAGAFLGLYADSPASLEVPYVVPQENGNRTGVRSIRLSGLQANGVLPRKLQPAVTIAPDRPVHMGVSRYTPENVWEARHTCDLVDISGGDEGYYFLTINRAQRGVGTATCGPDTLEKYRVRPGIFSMRLYFF